MNTLHKVMMIHVPGKTEPDCARFHQATENDGDLNTYKLLISGSLISIQSTIDRAGN